MERSTQKEWRLVSLDRRTGFHWDWGPETRRKGVGGGLTPRQVAGGGVRDPRGGPRPRSRPVCVQGGA